MMYLLYSSLGNDGQSTRRFGQYPGLVELDNELSLQGEKLIDYHILSDGIGKTLDIIRRKPKPLEIAEFCTTLSYYVSGGVDLQGALADFAESTSNSAMRTAIIEIRRRLKGGYTLSEAMRMSGRFPEVVISMSKIGEEGGELPRMLWDAAQHIERVEAIRSAAKRALIYPAFTLLAVGGAGVFWMAVVVPKIVELFETMQVELEPATLALIAMSDFFSAYWPFMLATVLALPLLLILALRNPRFKLKTDQLLWRLPFFGRIVRGAQMAFYFQYLALMYGAGVVITSALGTMQDTVSNKYFALRMSSMLQDLQSGQSLTKAFRECGIFPLLDQRMVSIGEQTGNLEEQLKKLANVHFNKVQSLVELMPKFIEPILLVVLGGCFAFFVVALLGPLYSMLSSVGGM